jgi:hypothetical protein
MKSSHDLGNENTKLTFTMRASTDNRPGRAASHMLGIVFVATIVTAVLLTVILITLIIIQQYRKSEGEKFAITIPINKDADEGDSHSDESTGHSTESTGLLVLQTYQAGDDAYYHAIQSDSSFESSFEDFHVDSHIIRANE